MTNRTYDMICNKQYKLDLTLIYKNLDEMIFNINLHIIEKKKELLNTIRYYKNLDSDTIKCNKKTYVIKIEENKREIRALQLDINTIKKFEYQLSSDTGKRLIFQKFLTGL